MSDKSLADDMLKKVFSKRLKSIMDNKNINQAELSKILGVSESTVGKWILKKSIPRMGIIQKLSDYFNVGKTYFLEDAVEELPPLTKKDNKNIEKIVASMRERLVNEEGLMFDGKPASPEAIQSIIDAMTVGMGIAKQRNKAKYTPKKYRDKNKE